MKLNQDETKLADCIFQSPELFRWITDIQIMLRHQSKEAINLILRQQIEARVLILKKQYLGESNIRPKFWHDNLFELLDEAIRWGSIYNQEQPGELMKLKFYEEQYHNSNVIFVAFKWLFNRKKTQAKLHETSFVYRVWEIKNELDAYYSAKADRRLIGKAYEATIKFRDEIGYDILSTTYDENNIGKKLTKIALTFIIRMLLIMYFSFIVISKNFTEKEQSVESYADNKYLAFGFLTFLNMLYTLYVLNQFNNSFTRSIDKERMAVALNIDAACVEQYGSFRLIKFTDEKQQAKLVFTPLSKEEIARISPDDFKYEIVESLAPEVESSYSHLKKQGFSKEEIKDLKKPFDDADAEITSRLASVKAPVYTWAKNNIGRNEVKLISGLKTIGNEFLYFHPEIFSLLNIPAQLVERFQTVFVSPKFCGPVNEFGLKPIDYKNLPFKNAEIIIAGEAYSQVPITHEIKIAGPARILLAKLKGDDGRSSVYLPCCFLEKGLHTQADIKSFKASRLSLNLDLLRESELPARRYTP